MDKHSTMDFWSLKTQSFFYLIFLDVSGMKTVSPQTCVMTKTEWSYNLGPLLFHMQTHTWN